MLIVINKTHFNLEVVLFSKYVDILEFTKNKDTVAYGNIYSLQDFALHNSLTNNCAFNIVMDAYEQELLCDISENCIKDIKDTYTLVSVYSLLR